MALMTRLMTGLDVEPLLKQLAAQPHLWFERPDRLLGNSPHRETRDIWVRYMDPALCAAHDFTTPHTSIWLPGASLIPAVRDLHAAVTPPGADIGGVLITRIPPGKQVYAHHDQGTWHAEWFTHKVWIPLRANDECINRVEHEQAVWRPGEAWTHDNLRVHSVENHGETERIVLICCFRKD
jgi:hypothetical protein